MYSCEVCGRQQSVTHGSESSSKCNQWFEKHFGDLVVTRGKNHTFLGMHLNITADKKVEIEMKRNCYKQ